MHIHTRLQVALALMMLGSVPLSLSVNIHAALSEKYDAIEKIDTAMEDADHVHASGRGLLHMRDAALAHKKSILEKLDALALQKSAARREMIRASRDVSRIYAQHQFNILDRQQIALRTTPDIQDVTENDTLFAGIFRGIASLFPWLEATPKESVHAAATHEPHPLYSVHDTAKALQHDAVTSAEEYQELSQEYAVLSSEYANAISDVSTASARIAEVERVTREVQAQITALQRELARIDAKLVAKVERELIEKGLMSAQPNERSDGRIRSKQAFRWPVSGRISAGYYDSGYRSYFGVHHKGIDIVVPQGTPVVAATDGIVYLARDGGRFGYSYVLIGHRNGMATLYGHLNVINVQTGQEVAAGSVVGLSGGTPGTHGAGPMTTGAHLHFEVISNGIHINPMSILP